MTAIRPPPKENKRADRTPISPCRRGGFARYVQARQVIVNSLLETLNSRPLRAGRVFIRIGGVSVLPVFVASRCRPVGFEMGEGEAASAPQSRAAFDPLRLKRPRPPGFETASTM